MIFDNNSDQPIFAATRFANFPQYIMIYPTFGFFRMNMYIAALFANTNIQYGDQMTLQEFCNKIGTDHINLLHEIDTTQMIRAICKSKVDIS